MEQSPPMSCVRGLGEDRGLMFRRSRVALLAALIALPLLTLTSAPDAHATPPGSNGKIAYISNYDCRVEVYIANANGTGVTELTDSPLSDGPSRSPDGSSIAFSGGTSPSGIYTMSAAGSGLHRV